MLLSVEDSLKKLQTDYIDVLYVHLYVAIRLLHRSRNLHILGSWDYSTSIPEVMQALNALVSQNKVLYLGVSDTPGMRFSLSYRPNPVSSTFCI